MLSTFVYGQTAGEEATPVAMCTKKDEHKLRHHPVIANRNRSEYLVLFQAYVVLFSISIIPSILSFALQESVEIGLVHNQRSQILPELTA